MNGKSYPLESNDMKMDFSGGGASMAYMMAFIQLYDSEFEDLEGLMLTKEDYTEGYYMFPVALSAGTQQLPKGILRLKIDYAKPLPSPIVVLVFAEYEKTMHMGTDGKIEIVSP